MPVLWLAPPRSAEGCSGVTYSGGLCGGFRPRAEVVLDRGYGAGTAAVRIHARGVREDHEEEGRQLRRMVYVMAAEQRCPYSKSDMTPCVRKDGPMCFAMTAADQPVCVGCGRSPEVLDVDRPADWEQQVALYHKLHRPTRYGRRGR